MRAYMPACIPLLAEADELHERNLRHGDGALAQNGPWKSTDAVGLLIGVKTRIQIATLLIANASKSARFAGLVHHWKALIRLCFIKRRSAPAVFNEFDLVGSNAVAMPSRGGTKCDEAINAAHLFGRFRMSLSQLLLILRARHRIIVYTLLITVALALAASLVLPKTYKAVATVVLNSKGVDPVSGFALPAQLLPGYMSTQVDIINSKSVALIVVDQLKLAQQQKFREKFASMNDGSGTIRDWLAEVLLKKLDVTPSHESNVVDISFKGDTPQFAAAVANAFANAYQQTNLQLKVGPMKTASTYFNDQIKTLRDKLETAQNRLSGYQKEKGISSTDNRLDMETIRLNELTSQLVTVQGELMDASSRQRGTRGAGAAEAPDVLADPLIQNLKAALVQARARLAEVAQRFTPDHPRYEEAKAEVDRRRSDLNNSIRAASNGISNRMRILQQREASLATALAAQKARVLDLNRARDEMAVLGKEVESAQRAYDTATQRFSQTSLEGQSLQSEVALLNPALPPFKRASPKLLLNLLLGVAAGGLLGVGLALLAEVRDRKVRSAADLIEVLQAPVLGAFSWAGSPPRRARLAHWLSPQRLLSNQRGLQR